MELLRSVMIERRQRVPGFGPSGNAVYSPGSAAGAVDVRYRPDIDGMRAMAVIAVILFHFFPGRLPGGFTGVDIFFVLSGYLITGIILNSLRHGKFSISEFYSRRIRRIFPALSVVLLSCLAVGWIILIPGEWRMLAKSVLSGAGFAANLVRPSEAGYFNPSARLDPLLHLWSLGIEEQFYIAWPLALVVLWKVERRWKRRSMLMTAFLLIAGASFMLNIEVLRQSPNTAFFSPVTRMWELLAGATLARLPVMNSHAKRVHKELMSAAGVALIAMGLGILNESTPFPGWWTWLPVLGTILLVGAGPAAWLNRSVLASRPFVGVGLISYPLYLWHWPLLVFLQVTLQSHPRLSFGQSILVKAVILAVALTLSWATYKFVESPMRFSTELTSSFRVKLLVTGMTCIAVLAALSGRILKPRLDSPTVREMERAKWDVVPIGAWRMSPMTTIDLISNSAHSTLLVGDSHMGQYFPRARLVLKTDSQLASAIFATSGECPPLPAMNQLKPGYRCPAFYDYWQTLAHETRFSTVAISALWEWYTPLPNSPPLAFHGRPATPVDFDEAWRGLARDLRALVRMGKRVVLFASSPTSRTFDPELGFGRVPLPGFDRLSGISRTEIENYLAPVTRRLDEVSRYSGAEVISPRNYFCNDKECPAVDTDGSPIYRDRSHIRASKAEKFAAFVDDVLRPRPAEAQEH